MKHCVHGVTEAYLQTVEEKGFNSPARYYPHCTPEVLSETSYISRGLLFVVWGQQPALLCATTAVGGSIYFSTGRFYMNPKIKVALNRGGLAAVLLGIVVGGGDVNAAMQTAGTVASIAGAASILIRELFN